jgi:hypothetical protein
LKKVCVDEYSFFRETFSQEQRDEGDEDDTSLSHVERSPKYANSYHLSGTIQGVCVENKSSTTKEPLSSKEPASIIPLLMMLWTHGGFCD